MSDFDPYANLYAADDDATPAGEAEDPYAVDEAPQAAAEPQKAPVESKPKRKPARAKSEKATILAALTKYDEIRALDASDRSVLATILGTSDEPAQIVATIVTSGKQDTGALGALLDVANASAVRAGILSDKLHRSDPSTFRAAWALLANYSDIDPVVPRRNDVVEIFAEAAHGLSDADKLALSKPLEHLEF